MGFNFFNKGEKIERFVARIQVQSLGLKIALLLAWFLLISIIDILTGANYTFFIFHLFPIALSVWILDLKSSYFFILFAVVLTVSIDYLMGCPTDRLLIFRWNGWTTIFMFFIAVNLLAILKRLFANLESIVIERTESLNNETKQRIQLQEEVLSISESERQRIASDLHDVVCQFLTGISLKMKALEVELQDLKLPQFEVAARISKRMVQAIDLTRNCAEGLFPIELLSHNLSDIIHKVVKSIGKREELIFRCELDENVIIQSEAVLLELYHITQETIINIVKYAKANEVFIRLHEHEGWVRMEIEDNGVGFLESDVQSGIGLKVMKYRANKIGAVLQLNPAESSGTIMTCLWKAGA